jgi:hypothetical protein
MENKKGIALLITMMILGTVIAISVGVTVLITGETTITRLVDDSVFAVFAADAGYERMLYTCSRDSDDFPTVPFTLSNSDLGNGASYFSEMRPNNDCNDNILRSTGTYGNIKRAFEVTY